jgi:Golgi phosphoprotein 3
MPTTSPSLTLAEELLLLGLRDDRGTTAWGAMLPQALGGAVLAELVLLGRLEVGPGKRPFVELLSDEPTGDRVLDQALARVAASKRRARAATWASRFANRSGLRVAVAESLCRKGVLREEEGRVLWLFRRRVFPERDPAPERELLRRIRRALAGTGPVEPRLASVIAIAAPTKLLAANLSGDTLRKARRRIDRISQGHAVGKATREVVQAIQVAVMTAAIVPVVAAGS